MKAGELQSKPLQEVLQEMELIDIKIHTDDCGEVKTVELKYGEKQTQPETKTNPWQ